MAQFMVNNEDQPNHQIKHNILIAHRVQGVGFARSAEPLASWNFWNTVAGLVNLHRVIAIHSHDCFKEKYFGIEEHMQHTLTKQRLHSNMQLNSSLLELPQTQQNASDFKKNGWHFRTLPDLHPNRE